MAISKTKFNEMVGQLRSHINDRADHSYSICQILMAIRDSKLYEITGYESFREFCEEGDIGLSYSNASKHAVCFMHLKRIGYNKADAVEILTEFGVAQSVRLLCNLNAKVKISTLRRHSREWYQGHNQINFTMDPDELEFVESILMQHGMDFHDSGTRVNASEALVKALQQLTGKQPKAA